MRFWKIGELASRTGVTVRTLHYYDEIGLLSPSTRTDANYRMYSEEDVARLQQIVSLRQLGLSLEEIGDFLNRADPSPVDVIERHLEKVRAQIEAWRVLCSRLERLAEALRSAQTVSADELIQTVEMTIMFEKYYTPEQLQELEGRRQEIGQARIQEVEAEWPRLMEEVRAEMEKGTEPSDPRVQALARRWQDLVSEFTGGNPEISSSLNRMYSAEPEVHGVQTGPVRELSEYLLRAREV